MPGFEVHPSRLRLALLTLGLLSAALFFGAFLLSHLHPLSIERGARELLRIEVEQRVGERIDTLSNSRIAAMAERAAAQLDGDLARSRQALREGLPEKVANVVAAMLKADCECRKRLVTASRDWEQRQASTLGQLRERLTVQIELTYANVSASLMREFRIFTGANAVACLVLAVTVLLRRRATVQLLIPAVVLLGSVAIAGGLYLFQQNWLHTLVYGDYVGLGYAAYLTSLAAALADILLNRARMTTALINFVSGWLGAMVQLVPC